jgi:hypothetical protein
MLFESVRELIRDGFALDERSDGLTLRGRLRSRQIQARWIAIAEAPPAPFRSVQVYDVAIGGDLSDGDAFDPSRDVLVSINKPTLNGVDCFFFQSSLSAHFSAMPSPTIAIVELGGDQRFAARGLAVVPWILPDDPSPVPTIPPSIDPTPYVRDFVPQREVVRDLSPWLLSAAPTDTQSAVFAAWERVAARRLLGGLVSRVWLENNAVWLQVSGPPVFRIQVDDAAIVPAREKLTEAVTWVYLSGPDVEARHLIFAGELARASGGGQSFIEILERGFEAAKITYEAHVQSSSRETLKALADLRKTVIDETQKVAQRAQDLTAILWRDLAVSVAPFILKVLGDVTKLAGPVISAIFYFAAAGFVALSFALQWRINSAYFTSQSTSRQRWMRTLYSYISEREREEIAEAPIEQAMDNYRETRTILLVVYAVLVIALGYFGVVTLNQPIPSAAPNAVQSLPAPPESATTR